MDNEQNPKSSEEELPKEDPSWTSGDNFLTDMSEEERKKYLGYVPGPGEPSLEERERKSKENAETDQSAKDADD